MGLRVPVFRSRSGELRHGRLSAPAGFGAIASHRLQHDGQLAGDSHLGARHDGVADGAGSARAVLDAETLSELIAEPLRDEARDEIDRAARGEATMIVTARVG